MKRRTKTILTGFILALSAASIAAVAITSVDARSIGRTDPKRASHYRLPWFNFAETYTDGQALGITTGSTKAEAIDAAMRAGLIVEPSGWGDNRAGGADLYERSELLATMLRQRHLNFYDPEDTKRGVTINFRGGRVASIHVFYINFEAI
jgi:hypothetical protein